MAAETTVLDCIVENINTINAATTEIASLVAGASDEERAGIVRALDWVRAIAAPAKPSEPETSPELDRIMTQFGGVLQALAPHDREGSDVVCALTLFGAKVAWEYWLSSNPSGGFETANGTSLDCHAGDCRLMRGSEDEYEWAPRPHVVNMVRHLLVLDKS